MTQLPKRENYGKSSQASKSSSFRLLPWVHLEETVSGQELIKDEQVKTLTRQVARKFSLSPEIVDMLQAKLDTLDADSLAQLLDQIIDIDSFAQFQQRVAECQSLVSV